MSILDQNLSNGRYRLIESIGSGGMATVYRGFDSRLQVHRAIKVLAEEYANRPKVRARFDAEARTMALLDHPNIVRVYDVGNDENRVWIVMELVEGPSLLERIEDSGALDSDVALRITTDVLEGLAAAHAQGVVHRDIKPHNIMLGLDDRARITDFGIARSMSLTEESFTKTGAVMGTWAFMAPEQRVNAKGVDHTADLYGMGATLFAMVTRRTPMDLFAADLDPVMLEDVPDPLRPLIRRSTRYQRQERYVDALEMLEAVRSCRAQLGREERPIRTPQPPSAQPTSPPAISPSTSGARPTYLPDTPQRGPSRSASTTQVAPASIPQPPPPTLPPQRPVKPAPTVGVMAPTDSDTLLPEDEVASLIGQEALPLEVSRSETRNIKPIVAIIVAMLVGGIAIRVVRALWDPSSDGPSGIVDNMTNRPVLQVTEEQAPVSPPQDTLGATAQATPSNSPPSLSSSSAPPALRAATPTREDEPEQPSTSQSPIRLWHQPVTNGRVGDSLRITANIREIEPQDHRYYSAHVAYRPSGGTQYTKLEMTRTGKIWKAYIQVTPALSSGFEYLVVAKPNPTELPNRSKLLSGQPQSPHRVRIHRN